MMTVHREGSVVPESGIYDVIHDNQHAQRRQVTCIKGNRFPPCRTCNKDLEYRLVKAAIHIADHPMLR